jgi:hypothetical protein
VRFARAPSGYSIEFEALPDGTGPVQVVVVVHMFVVVVQEEMPASGTLPSDIPASTGGGG